MTKTTERRISHDELHLLSLRCKHCQGEMRIDLHEETQARRAHDGPVFVCPLCGYEFQAEVMRAVKAFIAMRSQVAEVEDQIIFCVEEFSCD